MIHKVNLPIPSNTDLSRGYSADVINTDSGPVLRLYMHLKDGRGHYRDWLIVPQIIKNGME